MRFAAAWLVVSLAPSLGGCGGEAPRTPDGREAGPSGGVQARRAETPPQPGSASETDATASFEARFDDNDCMHTSSVARRFTPAVLTSYPGGDVDAPVTERLLLTETVTTERLDDPCGAEGGGLLSARLSVVAASLDEHGVGTRSWSFEESEGTNPAHFGITPSGDLWPSAEAPAFYRVTYDSDLGIYRSLRTGERLFAATSRLLRIEIPRSPLRARFIAFHYAGTWPPPPEAERDEKVIGVLQYGDDQRVFERLVLVGDSRPEYAHLDVILVLNGQQTYRTWGFMEPEDAIDRRQIRGFAILVELYPSHWKSAAPVRIEVPIESDEFAVHAATLPAGVRIRR